jgi:hypothetical protein
MASTGQFDGGVRGLSAVLASDVVPDGELVDVLFSTRVESLSGGDLVRYAQACHRVESAIHALKARAAEQLGEHLEPQLVQLELSTALNVGEVYSGSLMSLGFHLTAFPLTGEALEAGRISVHHARVLFDLIASLDPRVAAEVEPTLIDLASRLTLGKFRKRARSVVAAADPEAFTEQAKAAEKQRRVAFYGQDGGQATVAITGPAAQARAIYLALDCLAGPGIAGDDRGVDERRFDAAFSLAADTLGRDDLPQRHRRFVSLGVTLTLDAALGLSETPAELAGYGPIPAYAARDLYANAEWRAFLIDAATAHLLALGAKGHDLSAAAQDFIQARDGTCSWVTCDMPASRCDTEHAIPWPDGASDPTNCGPVSRRHHNAKTRGHWRMDRHPDGQVDWTSPLGFTYTFHPPPHPHERQ